MADESDPPVCDPICQKMILDGVMMPAFWTALWYRIEEFRKEGGRFTNPARVLKALIEAENASHRFKRVVAEEMGYHGQHGWPDHLKNSGGA